MHWLKLALLTLLVSGCGSEDRGKAYVSSQEGFVTVIDLNSMEVIDQMTDKGFPRGIGVTEDGKYIVTRIKKGLVFVSTEPSSTGKPPSKEVEGHEEDNDDNEEKIPAKVAVVDLLKAEKVREITAGPETEGIEFSKDGNQVIVTNEADNSITVHDFDTGKLLKTFSTEPYGLRPRGIKLSPNGEIYVATLEFSDNFIVLDKNLNYIQTVKTGKAPYGVSFNTAGDKIFVAAGKSRTLEVFDTKDFSKIKDIPTEGKRCWHFSFTPDDKDILLTCGRSDEIVVINAASLEVTKRIPVNGIPWGIVTNPRSMGSLDQPE
jgi:YVTN family beta-propeller protein